MFHIVNNIIIL